MKESLQLGAAAAFFASTLATIYNYTALPTYEATTAVLLNDAGVGGALPETVSAELCLKAAATLDVSIRADLEVDFQDRMAVKDRFRARLAAAPPERPAVELATVLRSRIAIAVDRTLVTVTSRAHDRGTAVWLSDSFANLYARDIEPREEPLPAAAAPVAQRADEPAAASPSSGNDAALQGARAEVARASTALTDAQYKRRLLDDAKTPADPTLNAARDEAISVRKKLDNLLLTLGEKHPDVVAARAALDQAERAANERMSALKTEAGAAVASAERALEKAAQALAASEAAISPRSQTVTPAPTPGVTETQPGRPHVKRVRAIVPASLPLAPLTPRRVRNLALAALVGFVAGLGLAKILARSQHVS